MSQEQLQRIKVIENAVAGREEAEYLNFSERQMQRLKGMHCEEDPCWVYHGNQGRAPAMHLSPRHARKYLPQIQDSAEKKPVRIYAYAGRPAMGS